MKRQAFTLVELLVVIAIIGILIGLLVPAVQSAREAGRRTQCANNLNQITKAAIQHETAHGYYPTGGWTGSWSGDPNCGTGQRQPGGWTYNILPFIEQQPLHDMGLTSSGLPPADPKLLGKAAATPLGLFYCPTRRVASVYPVQATMNNCNTAAAGAAGRTDYAANAGTNQGVAWTGNSPPPPTGSDPSRVTQFLDTSAGATAGDGVIFTVSMTTHADIRNGSSNMIMFGEKYLTPDHYPDGADPADSYPIFAGFANDWERYGGLQVTVSAANTFLLYTRSPNTPVYVLPTPPMHDLRGTPNPAPQGSAPPFGSAHVDGINIFTCDGSGHWMSYSVDPQTFAMLCSRQNANPIDAGKLRW